MQEKRYLLDIRQMLEGGDRDALLQKAFDRIDGERRQKAFPIKNTEAQASGVGAGLLIQKALTDYMSGGRTVLQRNQMITGQARQPEDSPVMQAELSEGIVWQCLSVEKLLMTLNQPVIEPCYKYGKNGKPYLEGVPFYFNLSHSGCYVFCGVSAREIGVDIQKIQKSNELRLAKRFFSSSEYRVLENCGNEEERSQMFFRMWTRKEAYGKLTGEGLGGSMAKNLWTEGTAFEENGLSWEEYDVPPGYRIAVCAYAI